MLKISVLDTPGHRLLVLEGKLIAPWVAELSTAFEEARADLDGRELIIEVRNLAEIDQAGENLIVELMNGGVKFRATGVFTKYVLNLLALKTRQDF
jgi:hypothetical protein